MSIETTDSRLLSQMVSRHEPMSRAPADLAIKLDLALKLANMSKGRLALETRVDKSLVGRWVRGLVVPSEHNLVSMTEALSRKFPGFNLASWHLQPEAFAKSIGGAFPLAPSSAPIAPAQIADNFLARSFANSIGTMADERRFSLGVYLGFRHGLYMGGRLLCDIYVIWREGDALLFKQFGVAFAHGGPACVLRGQIYLMGEDLEVIHGLYFAILIGVLGGRAMRMDGVMLTVAGGYRVNAPTATAIVMQRIADLPPGDGYPDQAVLDRALQRIKDAVAGDNIKALIAPEILATIVSPGAQQSDGASGHTLSVGMGRALGCSEIECSETIARYSKTLREVFLAEDAPMLPMGPASGVVGVTF
jgi:hypothetical protein